MDVLSGLSKHDLQNEGCGREEEQEGGERRGRHTSTWEGRGQSLEGREPLGPPEVLLLLRELLLLRTESRKEALRLRAEVREVSQPGSDSLLAPTPTTPTTPSWRGREGVARRGRGRGREAGRWRVIGRIQGKSTTTHDLIYISV